MYKYYCPKYRFDYEGLPLPIRHSHWNLKAMQSSHEKE
uniref:Uncharacterized protein n=1 Tax=Arundo donax TaxID=35708 RepID=A0A0A8ZF20_ARUDO